MPTDATPLRSTRLCLSLLLLLVVPASGFFHSLPRGLQRRHHHAESSKAAPFPSTPAVTLGATTAGVMGDVVAGAHSEGEYDWFDGVFQSRPTTTIDRSSHTC